MKEIEYLYFKNRVGGKKILFQVFLIFSIHNECENASGFGSQA